MKRSLLKDPRDLMELIHDAELHDTSAALEVAYKYRNGSSGIPRDTAVAMHWFFKAARRGNAEAQFYIAMQKYSGSSSDNILPSLPEAAYWFREAALQGHVTAQASLGSMYRDGRGVGIDYAQAAIWFRAAAERGSRLAQIGLGNIYDHALGVEQNDTEAMKWYRLAADQGDPMGENNVGWMYDLGQGVRQDDTEARCWFQKSANAGFAAAQFTMGSIFELGQGVERSDQAAFDWYRVAASQFESDAILHCQLLGSKGRDSLETHADFVAWHRQKAEDGDPAAQYNIGLMNEKGLLGVLVDTRQAIEWYAKAAEQDHENARQRCKFLRREYPGLVQ